MLKRKITKIKNQLKKNKSLHAGFCMTFQKCHLLIFFKVTFFRKITNKSGITSVSNSLDQDQIHCVFGTSSLIWIQNCFSLTLADGELTGFFIFAAFYLL